MECPLTFMEMKANVAENAHHKPASPPPSQVFVKQVTVTKTRYRRAVRRSFSEVAPEKYIKCHYSVLNFWKPVY